MKPTRQQVLWMPRVKNWERSAPVLLRVAASGVTLENLTVRNSFDFPANSALPADDPNKLKDTQAVALMVGENIDNGAVSQSAPGRLPDTFYSKNGSRSYFTDCEISGHVDFIFGGGIAVFDRCTIIARNRSDIAPPLGISRHPAPRMTNLTGLFSCTAI